MSIVKRQKTEQNGLDSSLVIQDSFRSEGVHCSALLLEGHSSQVMNCGFSPDGSMIASAGLDSQIMLWSMDNILSDQADESQPNVGVIQAHKNGITCLKWSSDGEYLFSSGADQKIGIWDLENGKRTKTLQGHKSVINEFDVYNDSIVSVGDDGCVLLWDTRSKQPVKSFSTSYPLISCCFNKSNGNMVYASGIDPAVYAFDVRKFDTALWTTEAHTDTVTSLTTTRDGTNLFSRGNDGFLRYYDCKNFVPEGISRARSHVYDGAPSGMENLPLKIDIAPDGSLIASGSADKTVTIWDLKTRQILNKLAGHEGTVIDVAFHPTEKWMVSCSTDKNVILRQI